MIKIHIQSNKGSTLAMMILVIGILVILGSALLTATFVGITAKMEENRKMTAFYIADAGLEEAYAYLGEEAENASQYSRKVYVVSQLNNHPEYGLLTDQAYKVKLDELYAAGFKHYFISNINSTGTLTNMGTLVERLNTKLALRAFSEGPHQETFESVTSKILNPFTADVANTTMDVEFKTVVARRARDQANTPTPRRETITTVLQVSIPSYETAYYKQSKRYIIKKNPLFDKAIAVDGNFYAMGGKVYVNGNLYAHGTTDNNGVMETADMGGVIIGGMDPAKGVISGGSLEVAKGDIDTARYVRIASSTDLSPGTLELKGNMACNSLVIQELFNSQINSGADAHVTGNLEILDDTELNGLKSKITIDGSYYGFSDGKGSTSMHDQSSGIIINSDDIDTASKLTIAGAGSGRTFPDTAVPSIEPGIYLSGTVYVEQSRTFVRLTEPTQGMVTMTSDGRYRYTPNSGSTATTDSFMVHVTGYNLSKDITVTVDRPTLDDVYGYLGKPYQTGDSVSIVGNYLSYGKTLSQNQAWYKNADDFAAYDNIPGDYFTDFTPIDLVEFRKAKSSETGTKIPMTAQDKTAYTLYVNKQEPTLLDFGNGNVVLDNLQYALGTYITKSGDGTGVLSNKTPDDLSSVSAKLANVAKEFNFRVNALSNPQEKQTYLTNATAMTTYSGVASWLEDEWNQVGTLNIQSWIPAAGTQSPQFFYAKNTAVSRTQALILIGENGSYAEADLERLRSSLTSPVEVKLSTAINGLVLAHSDIYCIGTINYTGLLLTDKDIYCVGDGIKTFTNTETSAVGNFVTDMAFKGLRETHDTVKARDEAGYWFKHELAGTQTIEKPVDVAEVYSGSNELGYSSSLAGAVRVTRWYREPY